MSNLYTEKDMADVVDGDGNVVGRAPKSWKDAGLLSDGQKIKGGRSSSNSAKDDGKGDTKDENPVPAETESRDALEAYAVEHAGISEEDAKAFSNKGELHAAIVAAKA
jgi:hypothetical protein